MRALYVLPLVVALAACGDDLAPYDPGAGYTVTDGSGQPHVCYDETPDSWSVSGDALDCGPTGEPTKLFWIDDELPACMWNCFDGCRLGHAIAPMPEGGALFVSQMDCATGEQTQDFVPLDGSGS